MTDPNKRATASAEPAQGRPDVLAGLVGDAGLSDRLRSAGIPLTLQRLAIAHVMLARPAHLTADGVLLRVRAAMPEISRATVYNTLKLFKERGLVRDIVVPEHVVFDSTVTPHHHYYDVDTGEVTDVPAGGIEIVGTASLPAEFELQAVDVVVRVRRRSSPA